MQAGFPGKQSWGLASLLGCIGAQLFLDGTETSRGSTVTSWAQVSFLKVIRTVHHGVPESCLENRGQSDLALTPCSVQGLLLADVQGKSKSP